LLKRALLLFALTLPLLAIAIAPRALAQGGPILIAETRLPQSSDIKYPHVDTLGATVYVSGNAERSYARLWAKQDSAGSFGVPRLMGPAESNPDHTSAAVFTAPDGTIHYVWTDHAVRRVLLRSKKPTEADFGPTRLVTGASPFPVEAEVAANEDGVFVFWREPDQPARYRRSADGITFTPTGTLSDVQVEKFYDVAAAAGRRLALAYTRGRGDYLQTYVAVWNGSAFVNERIPTVEDRNFAEPSVAFLPDGGMVAALRSTESVDGFGAGVYVSDRSPAGAWSQVARLVRGETLSVSLDTDQLGNVHLFWISRASGGNDLWYTARRAGEGYGGSPLIVDTGALPIFDVRAAANLSDRSYGHAVTERFQGAELFGQYFVFGLPVNLVGAASIAIEDGQLFTNKPAVNVSFTGVQGGPTQVRWRWGAPPTDAASDSGGFQPFSAATPLAVPLPALPDPAACTTLTLYTQLRAGTLTQASANSDAITVDRAVQTAFSASSPDQRFSPSYTRIPTATITLNNALECVGLTTATVDGPIVNTPPPLVLDVLGKPTLQLDVGLTGDAGPKTLTFIARDLLGNTTTVSRTVIYDPVPPLLSEAGAAVEPVPEPDGTVIVDIALSEVLASDNFALYGIAVTPNVTPTGGSTPVAGRAIIVPFSEMNVNTLDPNTGRRTLRVSVNLADGLPASALVPGRYDLVITMLDAAGNQSLANAVRSVTLGTITYPSHLPIVR
jgi:hypothetical protein